MELFEDRQAAIERLLSEPGKDTLDAGENRCRLQVRYRQDR